MCTPHLNAYIRARRDGESPTVRQTCITRTQKDRLKPEAHAILSCLSAGDKVFSGMLERELRKFEGVKEIAINHISHAVKIRHDPHLVSAEKMRSVLRKLGQGN